MIQFLNEHITLLSCVAILIVCIFYATGVYKIYRACVRLKRLCDNENDVLRELSETKFDNLREKYESTIKIEVETDKKTNIPASVYFNENNIYKSCKINIKQLDTAAGTLVGLGLLGTFLGLTLGIMGFDNSDSSKIQDSINNLLNGMGTAFLTSLVGMTLSMFYIFFDKLCRNQLSKYIFELTEKLDAIYYIDDIDLAFFKQKKMLEDLVNESIVKNLTYTVNDKGDKSSIGNAIREILRNNEEQSKALQSFTTDLASAFDAKLSDSLSNNVNPLIENIENKLDSIGKQLGDMSGKITSPATDMIQKVIAELQNSMSTIMEEFKKSLSGSATQELENLAKSLETATEAMGEFPNDMNNISNTLKGTIEEVKKTIKEISSNSANNNVKAVEDMKQQIEFASASINQAIQNTKAIMENLTQSSERSSQDIVNKLAEATEKMSETLNRTIDRISRSVTDSMSNITNDITNKQTDLLALQEGTTAQTQKMLGAFSEGVTQLNQVNGSIKETLGLFKQMQNQMNTSTTNMQTITGNLKAASDSFQKSQEDYAGKILGLQEGVRKNMEAVGKLLLDSGEMSEEYAEKFEVIKSGLSQIFNQLQSGLTEYSKTVAATTQKYLDLYSTNLTKTTDALSSTIQQLQDVVELFTETLDKRKI